MATLVGDVRIPRPREILTLLAPFPGRSAIVTRIALICALTALVTCVYGTPEAAVSVYVVFFLNRPDRVTSVLMAVALLVLVSLVIGVVTAFANLSADNSALRIVFMAVLSIGMLFITSASKLKPVGGILAMIMSFGLDEFGLVPFGEAATRGYLYAWLFVSIPIAVSIVVNLVTGASPRRLVAEQLARRLRLAAQRLGGDASDANRRAIEACLAEGNKQIGSWLRLSKLEGSSTAEDVAALGQAAASSTLILVAADLIASEPANSLPAAYASELLGTLEQMASLLEAGGYPVDIHLDLPGEAVLPPLAALALADLRTAIEGFAEPQPESVPQRKPESDTDMASAAAPAPAPAPPKSGFFDADVLSNRDHIRYALKTTGAAMFCYLLYQQLDWSGIHTCFITCYIVSLGTTAETVEKLTLRIVGCLIGALLGLGSIVFLMPSVTSVGELMLLVFAGTWLSAWVAMGAPRISYAGMQIAFAFLLCVLQGSGPGFDLVVARDRVIGILLGNFVVYLMFTRVWPVSIAKRVDATVATLLDQWRTIVQIADPAARRARAAEALVQGASVRQDFGLMHYEPNWVRPAADWIASRRRVLTELGDLEMPLFLAGGHAGAAATGHAIPTAAVRENIDTQLGRIADTVRTYEAKESMTDARF